MTSDPAAAIQKYIEAKLLMGKKLAHQDEPLFSSGAIDSFGVLELIAFLEKQFGIVIDIQRYQLQHFDTIPSILKVIHGYQK
jgi:acyl carrier protein